MTDTFDDIRMLYGRDQPLQGFPRARTRQQRQQSSHIHTVSVSVKVQPDIHSALITSIGEVVFLTPRWGCRLLKRGKTSLRSLLLRRIKAVKEMLSCRNILVSQGVFNASFQGHGQVARIKWRHCTFLQTTVMINMYIHAEVNISTIWVMPRQTSRQVFLLTVCGKETW